MTGDVGLIRPIPHEPILTLAASAPPGTWQAGGAARFGSLGAHDERRGRAWLHGKLCLDDCCEVGFGNARVAIGVSRGVNALTPLMAVDEADGHEVFRVDGEPALTALSRRLPDLLKQSRLPMPPLMAARVEAGQALEDAIATGTYRLIPLLAVNHDEESLTLASAVFPGEHLFWAQVQPGAAVRDSHAAAGRLAALMPSPAFALMFTCIGRGPYFFGGENRDLAALREAFPALPVLGGHGAEEIAPVAGQNAFISYSAVMALIGHVQS